MKDTQNIDELITQVLNKEEAEFYHKLDDPDLSEMISGLYQGKFKWLSVVISIVIVALFMGAVFSVFQFLKSTTTSEMLAWGFGVFLCFMAVGFLKLISLLQLYSNKITREMKRLEFQISVLSNKVLSK
jgi:hypothetical protein